jgi:hypothetical protein
VAKIKNMGTATMRFGEGVIVTGSAGTDTPSLVVTGSVAIKQGSLSIEDAFTFPNTDGNNNQVLTTDGLGNLSFQTQATGSGANPPGGADRQIQFNDNGSFAGNYGILVDANFNLKASGSLIAKESIGIGTDLGGGRNASDEWVAITAPEHKFHVIGDNTEAATFSIDSAADSTGGAYWSFAKARGTPASPTGVSTNDEIARIQFFAHTGTSTLKRSALILAQADSDGDGRLKFYVTKEGDVDNVAIECYNNQVTVQDQLVIGSSGIIPISNGGASIGGSSSRFDYMRANNLVAYESLQLGGTHPIYDKAGFGISINKDNPILGNYTSGEGLVYISNSSAVENVMFALHKTGSHFGGMALNGTVTDNDQKIVFFSQYNTAGFEWKNNIPYYNANGMGNLNTTGTKLMDLDSGGNLVLSGTVTGKDDQLGMSTLDLFLSGENNTFLAGEQIQINDMHSNIADPGADVFFYVSGSIGGTGTSGTSLFGGDLVVSGNVKIDNGSDLIFQKGESETSFIQFINADDGTSYNAYFAYQQAEHIYISPGRGADFYLQQRTNVGGDPYTFPFRVFDDGRVKFEKGQSDGTNSATDLPSDTNFYVSGSIGTGQDMSVFGGAMLISGSLQVEQTASIQDFMMITVSADNTDLQTGTGLVTLRAPFGMELYQIPRASLSTAGTSGTTVDINVGGTTIMTTNKLTIDANEGTSTSATTAAALTTTTINDDDQITIDVDTAGTGARGLKVILYYRRSL